MKTIITCVLRWCAIGSLTPVILSATTYYVDPNGSDSNNGTALGAPFLTIQKAASVMVAGDTCLIRAGTYRETVTPANSGTISAPITFENYNGEAVTISGCDPITGWSLDSGAIYKAPMAWTLADKDQVFDDGVLAYEARWPNQVGTLTNPTTAVADSGTNATQIKESSLTASGSYVGATVWVAGGSGWIVQTSTVTAFDSSTKTLTIAPLASSSSSYAPKPGNRFYLSGHRYLLNMSNEWYHDATNQELFFWAVGGGMPTGIEAKRRTVAIDLSNRSFIVLSGLRIFAARITSNLSTTGCLLESLTCEYVTHSDLQTGTQQSNQGIQLYGLDNILRDSEVAYSSGGLVTVKGVGNKVINCYIHDGNYVPGYDGLVTIRGGEETLISHNTIEEAGGRNLVFGGLDTGANVVQYNRIADCGRVLSDLGLIYTANSDGDNTEIRYNWLHENHGEDRAVGIYFDNYTSNYVVHHNVIWNVLSPSNPRGPIHVNIPGEHLLVYNNTGTYNVGPMSSPYDSDGFTNDLVGTRFYNNILPALPASLTNYVADGNNLSSGYVYTNAPGGDFTLQSGSAGINGGVIEPGITDGYLGASPDIGAYEYGATQWTAGHDFGASPNPTLTFSNPAHRNRVVNPGFEYGDLTGWTMTDAQLATVLSGSHWGLSPSEGTNKAQSHGLRLGGTTQVDRVEQTVTGLSPGTTYVVTVWLRALGGESIQLGVSNYNGSASQFLTHTSTTWTKKQVTFTTGTSDTSAKIVLKKPSSGTNYVYADAVGLQLN